MLSSFKSVYLVVCENFVSPGLPNNLPEILSFKKSQNLHIFQCRFAVQGYPPPWKKEKKEASTKLIPYLPMLHQVIPMWKVWANSVIYAMLNNAMETLIKKSHTDYVVIV